MMAEKKVRQVIDELAAKATKVASQVVKPKKRPKVASKTGESL